MSKKEPLNYDPETLPRELKRHYISATEDEIEEMLGEVGAESLEGLFKHIPKDVFFEKAPDLPDEFSYEEVQEKLFFISEKNNVRVSFLGDALPQYKVHDIVPFVSGIRKLTTPYTPYQPERSQGTLISHWIYQCLLSQITGFEAINASLYDRSTAIYEAICCAFRLKRNTDTVIISEGLFPQDKAVLRTLVEGTDFNFVYVPFDEETGRTSIKKLKEAIEGNLERLAGVVFPQVNSLGLLEDVDGMTGLCKENGVKSIAVIDPALLASGGLKPPSEFGERGVDIIAGEGQHLAIGGNFGGPGLGIFGVRQNAEAKNDVRHTPGRYVGKAKDKAGRDCFCMVLSTREQHIRKEKATSNICSNQAFLATLVGASVLAKGEEGFKRSCLKARENSEYTANRILGETILELAFGSDFYNEFVLLIPGDIREVIENACVEGLHVGVDVNERISFEENNLLKVSFSNIQSRSDCDRLVEFFKKYFPKKKAGEKKIGAVPGKFLRKGELGLPQMGLEEIKKYYARLGELNISPDDTMYPLGSCTMKYNPYINDWAATLKGFTDVHPQAPIRDVQGCLELLHEIQEWFKKITGLAGVTTQPVAGAQGELVALKLFQAYHKSNGEERDMILVPKSAHGTNFATAVMGGIEAKNIIQLDADNAGHVSMEHLEKILAEHGPRICGVMITNPNTGGLFEARFREIAEKVHQEGGLVFMDGANLNAIAGWIDLSKLGVDAVHSNLHKTFSIPHGGGGPGDAIVAVSEKLVEYLPGHQIVKNGERFEIEKPARSIGSIHRHWGNFAHKVRCYTYLLRLGEEGVRRMSGVAVLAAQYLHTRLKGEFRTLPKGAEEERRMHEFIVSLREEHFEILEKNGIGKTAAIPRVGKLFLDFGYHAPTVAFPEPLGLMIEPTETYSKKELDTFIEAVLSMKEIIEKNPDYLNKTPQVTPVDLVDEVGANRNLCLSEKLVALPEVHENRTTPEELAVNPIMN